jgi:hypothetical protein
MVKIQLKLSTMHMKNGITFSKVRHLSLIWLDTTMSESQNDTRLVNILVSKLKSKSLCIENQNNQPY